MPPSDKIKRAILWIRKTLEITEKTTLPGTVSGEIQPVIDAFGWDRYSESVNTSTSVTNVSVVNSPVVPEGFLRVVFEASVNTGNDVLAFTLWMELVHSTPSALRIGLIRPFLLPAGNANVRIGLERPLILGPGDNLSGLSNPATGAGLLLTLRQRSVDLPIGEYIPAA